MKRLERFRVEVGLALIVGGIVVAVAGYLGVSRETEVAFQLPYFASAGVGALLLFGAGAALLLAALMQRDDERIAELEEAVRMLGTEVGTLVDEVGSDRTGRRKASPNGGPGPRRSIRTRGLSA